MPQVRCPDCFQEVTVMHHELWRVIQCPICEAKIGPLTSPPPGTPPVQRPPAFPPATEVAEVPPVTSAPKPRTAGKRVKQRSITRFFPILLGILIGLGGTAALLGAMYVLITSQLAPAKSLDTSAPKSDTAAPADPPPTVRPAVAPRR